MNTKTYAVALVNITDGTVSGHKAGCADLKRGNLRRHADEAWTLEVEDKAEAWFHYNSDFLAEGGPDNAYTIEWAPCANHVPAGDEDARYAAAFGEDVAPVVEAPAPAPVKTSARTWNAQANGTHKCEGDCAEVKPAAAFPTTKQAGRRGVECRKCRDARLDRRG